MAYKNTKLSIDKNQEKILSPLNIKNTIPELPREQIIYFGKEFCKMLNSLPDSPWQKQVDPVAILKEKYNIKSLSKNQINLIYLLHRFFRSNKPSFHKLNSIAKQLNIKNENNISRTIKTLVEKNIILKIKWNTGKGSYNHGYKILLLPNIPNLTLKTDMFDEKEALKTDSLKNFTFISNLLKSKGNPTSLLSSIQSIFIYYKVYRRNKELKLFRHDQKHRAVIASSFESKHMEKKHMKLTLKVKEESLPSKEALPQKRKIKKENSLRDKFKKEKIDIHSDLPLNIKNIIDKSKVKNHLTKNELYILNNQINIRYGFDLNILFKNADNNKPFGLIENKLRNMFLEIVENKIFLDYKNTNNILNHFNSMNNKRFGKTNKNESNKSYLFTVIAVTYWSRVKNISNKDFIKAINRTNECSEKFRHFKSLDKIKLLNILVDAYKDIFEKFIVENEQDFKSFIFYKKANTEKYPEAQKHWKELFINLYREEEVGLKNYNSFQFRLVDFLNDVIDDAVNNERKLCGNSLSTPINNKATVIQHYLDYLKETTGNSVPMVKDICNHAKWINFVEHKMQDEFMYFSFWKTKKNKYKN